MLVLSPNSEQAFVVRNIVKLSNVVVNHLKVSLFKGAVYSAATIQG